MRRFVVEVDNDREKMGRVARAHIVKFCCFFSLMQVSSVWSQCDTV